jgi:hypothetical protein
MVFQQSAPDVEALEVAGRFIGRALLGYGRRVMFEPIAWVGDAQVARVASGESLHLDERHSLADSVDQARTVVTADISWSAVVQALASVNAKPAAFILAGMFTGALNGMKPFLRISAGGDDEELQSLAERLLQGSLAAEARPEHRTFR